jgi:hypothetical protein
MNAKKADLQETAFRRPGRTSWFDIREMAGFPDYCVAGRPTGDRDMDGTRVRSKQAV